MQTAQKKEKKNNKCVIEQIQKWNTRCTIHMTAFSVLHIQDPKPLTIILHHQSEDLSFTTTAQSWVKMDALKVKQGKNKNKTKCHSQSQYLPTKRSTDSTASHSFHAFYQEVSEL